jgi:hypothetical protein
MLYEGDDERFAAIIFTDRENGTSTLFAADGEAALSNSVAPA